MQSSCNNNSNNNNNNNNNSRHFFGPKWVINVDENRNNKNEKCQRRFLLVVGNRSRNRNRFEFFEKEDLKSRNRFQKTYFWLETEIPAVSRVLEPGPVSQVGWLSLFSCCVIVTDFCISFFSIRRYRFRFKDLVICFNRNTV